MKYCSTVFPGNVSSSAREFSSFCRTTKSPWPDALTTLPTTGTSLLVPMVPTRPCVNRLTRISRQTRPCQPRTSSLCRSAVFSFVGQTEALDPEEFPYVKEKIAYNHSVLGVSTMCSVRIVHSSLYSYADNFDFFFLRG